MSEPEDDGNAVSSDRIVALGVNQGDAFYLERKHEEGTKRILIDGGGRRAGLPKLLEKVGVCPRPIGEPPEFDIVVCTHNDFDHANGLIGLFQHSLRARELWLPAKLRDVLLKIVRDPSEFTGELAEAVFGSAEDWKALSPTEDQGPLEAYGEVLLAETEEEDSSERSAGADREVDGGSEDLELLDGPPDITAWLPGAYRWQVLRKLGVLRFGPTPADKLFAEALDTGERVLKLAREALNNGATLRWFEYQSLAPPSGGEPGLLVPLNANERLRVRRWKGALRELALTLVNQESLDLHSPGDSSAPAVIFSADSPFAFRPGQPIPWSPGAVVTAPHHGSAANESVYARAQQEGATLLTWLRSDRRTKHRPAPWYVNAAAPKYCTLCNSGQPKQDVALVVGSGTRWMPAHGVRACTCR